MGNEKSRVVGMSTAVSNFPNFLPPRSPLLSQLSKSKRKRLQRVYMRQHLHVCTSLYVSITSICVSVCPFVLLPQAEDERLLREAREMSVVRKKITNTDAYTSTEAQILTHIHALTSGRR